jgi:hypothetical protein
MRISLVCQAHLRPLQSRQSSKQDKLLHGELRKARTHRATSGRTCAFFSME